MLTIVYTSYPNKSAVSSNFHPKPESFSDIVFRKQTGIHDDFIRRLRQPSRFLIRPDSVLPKSVCATSTRLLPPHPPPGNPEETAPSTALTSSLSVKRPPNPFQSRASITAADHTGHGCSNTARRFAPLQVSPPSARRKSTPSATIAKIAAYLPKLCRISRYVVFHIADFLLFTSLTFCRARHKPIFPTNKNVCRRAPVLSFTTRSALPEQYVRFTHICDCSILHGDNPIRHRRNQPGCV